MSTTTIGDDGGDEWYEEPVTIVGIVAGFLLLVLITASILILCNSKDPEEEEDIEEQRGQSETHGVNQGLTRIDEVDHDKTNPLYIAANEFDLRPYPSPLRAKFVHIHVDEPRVSREAFEHYYNTGHNNTGHHAMA